MDEMMRSLQLAWEGLIRFLNTPVAWETCSSS